MMSKERDLLNLCAVTLRARSICPLLLTKIKELLAQPEQEQEPVAWRGVNFTEAEGDWLYRDIDEPFTDSNYRNVGEALYLAPPTREPLSYEKIVVIIKATMSNGLFALARAIEEQHGIGVDDE